MCDTTSGSNADPTGHTPDGIDEIGEVGHTVLEQVAHAFRAVGKQLDGVALFHVLREDKHADLGQLTANRLGGDEPPIQPRRCGATAAGWRDPHMPSLL